ncbi:thiamine-phosphate kinase [Hydrogenophaga sp. 5NK40-0174]|uniref:thiamine-phosphate kinase n=1 Tax=Hydrogenophaga sp. 5NK40-0174 TaxID=3127649 RepID=UPI00310574F4
MSTGEFDLIARHFTGRAARQANTWVRMGIGDDAAVLAPEPGHQMVISTDMLVEGRHFFADVSPEALGHKALAVNLSDLAAMGARPLGFTLALALPAADDAWLEKFAEGMFALAEAHNCPLLGGDTTKGPLNICITIFGDVPDGAALLRGGAQVGDLIYVSGTIGDAHLALANRLQGSDATATFLPEDLRTLLQARLDRPTPRNQLGMLLRGIASSAIDLSDGLRGDLLHLVRASHAGADIQANALPASAALTQLPPTRRLACQVNGGDDYELLFTAPKRHAQAIERLAIECKLPLTPVGQITADHDSVRFLDDEGSLIDPPGTSFDHFAQT